MKKLILTTILTTILTITNLLAVTYRYNEINQLEKVTYENGTIITYTYDDGGNLLSVRTEGNGLTDTDGDGIPDNIETKLGLNPNSADSDGDGLSDMDEIGDIDHPRDTDKDGAIDALDTDSDNDGVTDDKDAYPLDSSRWQSDTLSDISKEWIGVYRWTCGQAGFEPIKISLRQPVNSSTVDGNITIYGKTLDLNLSRRVEIMEYNKTDITIGHLSIDGKYIYLHYNENGNVAENSLYLEIKNDRLEGVAHYGNGTVGKTCVGDDRGSSHIVFVPFAADGDQDGDGLTDAEEMKIKTDMFSEDTDQDTIEDAAEVDDADNPLDTDGDGIINALDTDSDNDGVSDKQEMKNGTDPLVKDKEEKEKDKKKEKEKRQQGGSSGAGGGWLLGLLLPLMVLLLTAVRRREYGE